jgi:hypothetical protein
MRTSTLADIDPREDIVIIREQIPVEELRRLTLMMDGDLVKAVDDPRARDVIASIVHRLVTS